MSAFETEWDGNKQRFLLENYAAFSTPRHHAIVSGVASETLPGPWAYFSWRYFSATLRRLTDERLTVYGV